MNERCGDVRDGLVCDRERGHVGNHRGYLEQHDEVLFWAPREERPDDHLGAVEDDEENEAGFGWGV